MTATDVLAALLRSLPKRDGGGAIDDSLVWGLKNLPQIERSSAEVNSW